MNVVLILIFAVLAIMCFFGMVAEKEDVRIQKVVTIAFFVLVICITALAVLG